MCTRITLRILNIPATTRYFYIRTQFFFSAIVLGMAFNVLPSDILLLVWDCTVDQVKDGLSINVTTWLLYMYDRAILFLLLIFLKSVMLFSSCRCWEPVFFRSWVCEGYRCCFCRHFHPKCGAKRGNYSALKGGARGDTSSFEEEVAAMRNNLVSKKSKGVYNGSMLKFLPWMVENKRELVNPEFALRYDLAGNKKLFLKTALQNAPNDPPIFFEALTAEVFLTWIVSLRKNDGEKPGGQTYASHRSGLFDLFRSFKVTMSLELQSELKNHYKGLKRTIASNIAAGGTKIKSGKDPLSISLYRFLGLEVLRMDNRDSVFARTFMILTWNLICRASNTFQVCLDHMEWSEDSLCVFFSQMKNDQCAERPRDPRHIYANPLHPEICGILALGIYWSCYTFEEGEVRLFPGNNQYERFRKILSRMVVLENVALELERRAIDPQSLGTHSMRKGASTYGASGSTACPPSAALQLRAGWTLPGVQGGYLRHEAAGDMYVGRTVSGLPIDKPEFAVLPPNFEGADAQAIKEALRLVFPTLPKSLNRIGEFAMASLVYHREFLLENLPKSHPLLESVLFRNDIVYNKLKCLVQCKLSHEGGDLKGTGIPPHVSILSQMKLMSEELKRNIEVQNQNVSRIVDAIMAKLEEKAIGLGTVTHADLEDTLMKCLEKSGVMKLVRNIENPSHSIERPATDSRLRALPLYTWGGKLHYFPEDFTFPKGSVLEAWRYWCMGNESKGYPPLKRLTPDELSNMNLRKRLSDFKFLMTKIEKRAEELGIAKSSPSEEEAIANFEQCSSVISLPRETSTGKRRRTGQLTWITAVTILRGKPAQLEPVQDGASEAENVLEI